MILRYGFVYPMKGFIKGCILSCPHAVPWLDIPIRLQYLEFRERPEAFCWVDILRPGGRRKETSLQNLLQRPMGSETHETMQDVVPWWAAGSAVTRLPFTFAGPAIGNDRARLDSFVRSLLGAVHAAHAMHVHVFRFPRIIPLPWCQVFKRRLAKPCRRPKGSFRSRTSH